MQYTLLFDSHCAACSGVAALASEVADDAFSVRSLHDPIVDAQISDAGLALPGEPCLLVEDAEHKFFVLTGMRMRMRLLRLLGPSKASSIMRLIGAEAGARTARARDMRRDAGRSALSRRGLMGVLGAGTFGVITGLAARPAGAIAGSTPALGMTPASAVALKRLKATKVVQQAFATFGAVSNADMQECRAADGVTFFALQHRDTGSFTFVDATGGAEPFAFSMSALDSGSEAGLRYCSPDGTTLGIQVLKGDTLTIAPAPQPAGLSQRQLCWLACMSWHASINCANACFNCAATQSVGPCGTCFICAGWRGLTCARGC